MQHQLSCWLIYPRTLSFPRSLGCDRRATILREEAPKCRLGAERLWCASTLSLLDSDMTTCCCVKDIRVPGARVAGLPATTSFLDDSCQEICGAGSVPLIEAEAAQLLRVHQKESRWRWRLSLKDNTTDGASKVHLWRAGTLLTSSVNCETRKVEATGPALVCPQDLRPLLHWPTADAMRRLLSTFTAATGLGVTRCFRGRSTSCPTKG